MKLKISRQIKKIYNLSKKSAHEKNYYLDFHKEKGLCSLPKDFQNLVASTCSGDSSETPPPYMNTKHVFASKFAREVVSILLNQKLLDNRNISKEAKQKANSYLKIKNFSIGAYSDSQGIVHIRKNLIDWYFNRDGYKPEEDDLFLTYGRINSYEHVLTTIADSANGIVVPSPCYPFYLNFNRAMGLENVFYNYENIKSEDFCDNSKKLKINFDELEQNLKNARKTKNVKAMLVINPQDPIGEVMNYSQMSEIIDFCEKNKLVLIACESLQHSIYPQAINSSNTYVSFRHLVKKLNSNLELFSIQTLSQGPFFNGGVKSGLLDCLNIDPDVRKQIYKFKSIDLCAGVAGQIFFDIYFNKSNDLGDEFNMKYEKSLNDFKNHLQLIKNKVYECLKSEKDLTVRDIDAGLSFFVKNGTKSKFVIEGNELKFTRGVCYGKNMDEFTCIHIDENLLDVYKL